MEGISIHERWVACPCGAYGRARADDGRAAAAWNRRAVRPALTASRAAALADELIRLAVHRVIVSYDDLSAAGRISAWDALDTARDALIATLKGEDD